MKKSTFLLSFLGKKNFIK